MDSRKIIYTLIIIIIFIFTFSIVSTNKETKENVITTSSNAKLSNKKIGWGIKRNDNHKQPDLGSSNKNLLDKYEGIAMGNDEDKYVYLTFDEGYEAGYTSKLLDILKENEVKAAFFITGHYLNTQSDLVKRMIDEGHIVGNHTVNHKSMPDLDDNKIKEEVMTLHTAVYEKFRL
jgi:peptidoglycan-N-acetylmuramic acid deacetylase